MLRSGIRKYSANAPWRGGMLMISRSAHRVGPARAACFACSAGNERVQGHTLACKFAVLNNSASLVAEDQGWGAALVMTAIGMHVGSAYTDRFDLDDRFAISGRRVRLIAKIDLFGSDVNKRFHIATPYFAK